MLRYVTLQHCILCCNIMECRPRFALEIECLRIANSIRTGSKERQTPSLTALSRLSTAVYSLHFWGWQHLEKGNFDRIKMLKIIRNNSSTILFFQVVKSCYVKNRFRYRNEKKTLFLYSFVRKNAYRKIIIIIF